MAIIDQNLRPEDPRSPRSRAGIRRRHGRLRVLWPEPPQRQPGGRRCSATRCRGRARKVALTVNAERRGTRRIVEALKPDMLQLTAPKRRSGCGGAVAFRTAGHEGAADRADAPISSPIRLYAKVADRLIFDARAPLDATRPGGLGKPFDWTLLQGLDLAVPFMLSGGLDAGNVAEAMRITRRARRRRVVRRRERARRQGSREDPRLHPRRARGRDAALSASNA